ncbi:TetR family transcriptional regulator C-terminal domain-containing protein [Roseibium salinum]|nr:TetR family transcriptional regulator C-terminal domain-containing protein [Roseibium salinum]
MEMSAKFPEASRLFANEVMQGAPQILPILKTDLKRLVDEKSQVIEEWIQAGKNAPPRPGASDFHHLGNDAALRGFFSTQIRALTGKDLSDPDFLRETEAAVTTLILNGAGLKWPQEGEQGG